MSEADYPLIDDPTPPTPPPAAEGDRWRRWLRPLLPPWLTRSKGWGYLGSIAQFFDVLTDRDGASVRLRYPSASREDALPRIGADRVLLRGTGETAAAFAARLRTWRTAHRTRGSAWALLEQLRAFLGTDLGTSIEGVDVYIARGVRYRLAGDGTITREAGVTTPASPLGPWARAWVVYRFAASPLPLSEDERARLVAIPRAWGAAHVLLSTIVDPGDGVVPVWDVLDSLQLTWDELDALALTWDELEERVIE